MKKYLKQTICILLLLALLPVTACAEEPDYSPWLWFTQNGKAPESTGNGVIMWYESLNGTSFRPDLVPETYRPSGIGDVGIVLLAKQGSGRLKGFYTNGSNGSIYSVDVIAYDARTGVELDRREVLGGDPPDQTTRTDPVIYGDWPSDQQVAEAAAELCEALRDRSAEDQTLWRYIVRTEEDIPAILAEYTTTEEEALKYLVFDPGIEILGYDGYRGGVLEIPEEIDGLPVTAIGTAAFQDNNKFDEIRLPATVTRLGESAFANSYSCILNLPDGITVLPYSAVTINFNAVHLPASLKAVAYFGCSRIEGTDSDILPEGLEYLGVCAFNECFPGAELTLPRSLTSIRFDAFADSSATLRVYKDSYAYSFLAEGGWEAAVAEYAQAREMDIEEIDWCEKPAFTVIEE